MSGNDAGLLPTALALILLAFIAYAGLVGYLAPWDNPVGLKDFGAMTEHLPAALPATGSPS
jgi:hypothetical protein